VIPEPEELIRRILHLSATDDGLPELVTTLHQLMSFAPVSVGLELPTGTVLYRGTNYHISLPQRIDQIWFPPSHLVRQFGRANRPYSPIFYASSDPRGAFLEIDATSGNYAVLATWTATRPIVLHEVGFTWRSLRRLGAQRALAQRHTKLDTFLTDESRAIREFIATAFTNPTPLHYRVTAAIAEMSLACPDVAGIMYPSIANQGDIDNLALLPDFVRTALKLSEVVALRVREATPAALTGDVIARARISNDGNLEWEYTGKNVAPEEPAGRVQISAGERHLIADSGRLHVNGHAYDVLPGYGIEVRNGAVMVCDLHGVPVAPAD
jgi:RES domain-containing protein